MAIHTTFSFPMCSSFVVAFKTIVVLSISDFSLREHVVLKSGHNLGEIPPFCNASRRGCMTALSLSGVPGWSGTVSCAARPGKFRSSTSVVPSRSSFVLQVVIETDDPSLSFGFVWPGLSDSPFEQKYNPPILDEGVGGLSGIIACLVAVRGVQYSCHYTATIYVQFLPCKARFAHKASVMAMLA